MADSGQQAVAGEKLLPEKDLCFRVGGEAAGEERFLGAARRYAGKILEIRHISSCGHGSCKRPLELKGSRRMGFPAETGGHGSCKRPLELKEPQNVASSLHLHRHGSCKRPLELKGLSARMAGIVAHVMGLAKDPLN